VFFPGFLVSIPKVAKYIFSLCNKFERFVKNISLVFISRLNPIDPSFHRNVYFIVSWSTSNTDSYNLLCIRACNYTPVYTINCDKRRLLRHRSCSCACDIPYAMKNEKKGKESLVE